MRRILATLMLIGIAATGLTLPATARPVEVSDQADLQQSKSKSNGYYALEAENFRGHFVRHRNYLGYIAQVRTQLDRADSTWRLVPGLIGRGYSLESRNFPGWYLRHSNYRLKISPYSTTRLFKADATFYLRSGLSRPGGSWRSLESYNYPNYFIRHRNYELWLDRRDGSQLFKRDATFLLRKR